MGEQLQRYIPQGMSRIERLKEALRSYWLGPIMSSDPAAREFFGGSPTSTGVSVTESTALNYSAVWSAVGLIAGQVGNLPLMLYKKDANGGKAKFDTHPLYRLIHDRPNPETSSLVWREHSQAHVLTWGNLYTEIVRNGAGRPSGLYPITPDRVTPFRRSADAPIEYRVTNQDGRDVFIPAGDMIHVPGLGYDGICGYSVISKMRESIGLGLAAERFGGTFFGNGSTFGGVVSYPNDPPEPTKKANRDALNARHQGVDRAHKFLSLYGGAKYERLGIPPNDAQFLETRVFQVDEIARWFNLPPHKLKELMRSTNNNIEHQNLEYYIDCLAPWLERWEQELNEKLISPLERNQQEIEFVAEGLLRGDVASRGDFYSKQFSVGAVTPNDVRRLENRNPLTGGDDAFVPLNLIPLPLAKAYFEATIEGIRAKAEADRRPPPTPTPSPSPDPSKQREIDLLTEARDLSRRVAQEAEDARDRIAGELAKRETELAQARTELESEHAARLADGELAKKAAETSGLSLRRLGDELEAVKHVEADLRSALQVLTTERDAVKAALDDLRIGYDLEATARQQAALRESALIAERDGLIADKQAVDAVVSECRADIARLSAAIDVLIAERDEARAATEAANAVLRQSEGRLRELEAETARLTDVRAKDVEEKDAAVADMRRDVDTITAERDEARAATQAANTVLRESDARIAELEAETIRLTEARTNADAVNQATVTELRGQIAKITDELSVTVAALMEAKTAIGAAEAAHTVDRELVLAAEAERDQAATTARMVQARLSDTRQAIRAVLMDTIRILTIRESDRARKAQGTPEKLAKWIESFYPLHEDFSRAALRPAVRACLVVSGTDLETDRLLDRVLPAYIADSTRALQGVVQDADPETLGASLERVLRRWEAERAETWADRILKEAS